MDEKRIVPRLSMQIPVVLTLPDTGIKFEGRTRDISAGGVFFYAGAPVAEQQTVELLMTFSGDMTPSPILVSCQARVVRVERDSIAENTGIAVAIQQLNFLQGESAGEPEISSHIGRFVNGI